MPGNGQGRKHEYESSSDPDTDSEEVVCMKDLSGEINTTPEEAMNRLQQLFSTSIPVFTHSIPQVTDLTKSEVMKKLSDLMSQIASSVQQKKELSFLVPSRIDLGKDVEIKFPHDSRKTALMARILAIIFDLCREDITVTKKDLYYIDAKLFKKQAQSDKVIDDIACILRCTHESLHLGEDFIRGRVFGDLVFTQGKETTNCAKLDGVSIPLDVDEVSVQSSTAKFILIVEDEENAAYNRLVYDGFCTKFPCIVITGEGKPYASTRRFLKMLKEHLQIPVFALLDCNPHGLQMLSTYAFGPSFAIPDIHWIGLRPSDLDIYHIPDEYRSPLTKRDLKVAKGLLEHAYVKQNLDWVRELNIMLQTNQKAEVLALHFYGFKYMAGVYLPLKLQNLDWLNRRHIDLIS